LFPALALVIIAALVIGRFLLLPDEYARLGKHTAAGAGFVINLILWGEADYFDARSESKQLLHLWSLSIEEQFYLLFPVLLWALWRFGASAKATLRALIVIAIVSFLLCVVRSDPKSTFFLPHTRFWELLSGAVLAVATARFGNGTAPFLATARTVLGLIGLVLVLLSPFIFDSRTPHPGWWTILPVTGSCLLLWAGPDAWPNRWLMSNRVLVWIGLISYPLYLWHWVALSFDNVVNSGETTPLRTATLLAASVVAAALTYHLVERPIRRQYAATVVVLPLCALLACVGGVGLLIHQRDGYASGAAVGGRWIDNYKYDFQSDARVTECWLTAEQQPDAFAKSCVAPDDGNGRPLVVVWGDSHAARLYPGLTQEVGNRARLAQFTRNSCRPVLLPGPGHCFASNHYVLDVIKALRPATVVMYARWFAYGDDMDLARLTETINLVRAAGVARIVVLGPFPEWGDELPKILARKSRTETNVPSRLRNPLTTVMRDKQQAYAKVVNDGGLAKFVSVVDTFCDGDICLASVDGNAKNLVTWDTGHLTTMGARYLSRRLLLDGQLIDIQK
jgi:peptidoglycan/LPS O-acetylase OafA/YrhL